MKNILILLLFISLVSCNNYVYEGNSVMVVTSVSLNTKTLSGKYIYDISDAHTILVGY